MFGDKPHFKITDFDISRDVSVGGSHFTRGSGGTQDYKSPEVSRSHQYDLPSDIWGLGCLMLFFMAVQKDGRDRVYPLGVWADKARVEYTAKVQARALTKDTPSPPLPDLYEKYDCFKDILTRMLSLSPEGRLKAEEVRDRVEEDLSNQPFKPTLHEYRQVSQKTQEQKDGDSNVASDVADVFKFLQYCLDEDFTEKVGSKLHHDKGLALLLETPPIKDINDTKLDSVFTPLGYAAWAGSVEVVEMLLELGANIDAPDSDEATPLSNACRTGRREIVEILLQKTPRPKIDSKDEQGRTPLLVAVHYLNLNSVRIVEMLLKAGASVNQHNKYERSALHVAIEQSNFEITKLLVENKADTKAVYRGLTPLHFAARSGSVEIINFLVNSKVDIDSEAQDGSRNTPLHVAAAAGNQEAVNILLQLKADVLKRNNAEGTALHIAASEGEEEIITMLLGLHPELLRIEDKYGWNALHRAIQETDTASADVLIKAGLDVNKSFGDFGDCLQLAATRNNEQTVEYLLTEAGANVNAQGGWYGTALQGAARFGNFDIVKLLLEKGADINVECGWFGDALSAASSHGHESVAQLLTEHGAKKETSHSSGNQNVMVIDEKYWLPSYLQTSQYGLSVKGTTDNTSGSESPPYLPSSLDVNNLSSYLTLSNNDLDVVHSGSRPSYPNHVASVRANYPIPSTSGDYYFEITVVSGGELG
jgi:ankyrin repeat protein